MLSGGSTAFDDEVIEFSPHKISGVGQGVRMLADPGACVPR
jgi:hypothetical protein